MLYSILAYALAAYAALIVAGGLAGSVPAVLCTAASAFLAYVFQTVEAGRHQDSPITFFEFVLWGGSIAFGIMSAILSLTSGGN